MHHKDPLIARKSIATLFSKYTKLTSFLRRVIAFMVLSIIASLLAIPLIVFSGLGIGELEWRGRWDDDNEHKCKSKFLLSKFNIS